MKAFDDLKSQWKEQVLPEPPNKGAHVVIQKVRFLQKKQGITNVVLLTTMAILICFFFYINAYKFIIVSLGLLLMIGALILRVMIEYFSIKKLKQLDVTKDAQSFITDITSYYRSRIRTHYIATPIIILGYGIGFYLLLPSFKQSLSQGFYTYIVTSAVVILFVLGFFIFNEIRKELRILKEITKYDSEY